MIRPSLCLFRGRGREGLGLGWKGLDRTESMDGMRDTKGLMADLLVVVFQGEGPRCCYGRERYCDTGGIEAIDCVL